MREESVAMRSEHRTVRHSDKSSSPVAPVLPWDLFSPVSVLTALHVVDQAGKITVWIQRFSH
jgi:hypothetical protein